MVLVSAGTGRDRHGQSTKTVTRMGCVASKGALATTLCQQKVREVGQGIFTRVWLLPGRQLGGMAGRRYGSGAAALRIGAVAHTIVNLKKESRVATGAARTNQLKPRIKSSGVRTTAGRGSGSRWATAGAMRRTSSMTRTAGRTDDAGWLISITAVRKGKTLWFVAKEATGDQSATGQLPGRTRTPGPRRVGSAHTRQARVEELTVLEGG